MQSPKKWKRYAVWAILAGCLTACVSAPHGVEPVAPFERARYMGKWYEIARLDHWFERGLQQVTAEYSLRDDGGVKVINKGYDPEKGEWERADGKAYFVDSPDKGYLNVSFFGPFYGAYVIFEVGDDYEYAFVSGPNRNYLWLLARQPEVSPALYQRFIERARELGFDTTELIRVEH